MDLKEKLETLRSYYLGMSQVQFAKFLGTTAATVYRWESGKSKPSRNMSAKLNQIRDQFKSGVAAEQVRLRDDKIDWCHFVKSIRFALGKTQFELAVLLKTSVATVSCWETGRTKPSNNFVEKLNKLDSYVKKNNLRNTKAYQLKMKADQEKGNE